LHVFISHPELLQDLCTHLERSGCVVDGCYGLDIFIAVWQALHPGVEAYILEPNRVR
jgi:hypothetical protein